MFPSHDLCNKEYDYSEFHIQNSKKGTLRPYCKICDNARAKKAYHANRESNNARNKAYQKRVGYKAKGNYVHNAVSGIYGMFKDGVCYYIGASKNLYRRRSAWVSKATHFNIDMNEYVWGIMYEGDDYKEMEQHYISIYNPEFNTYK